ncbi:hypothetical protein ACWCP8_40135 [Streptomyces sp. NPDC002206]
MIMPPEKGPAQPDNTFDTIAPRQVVRSRAQPAERALRLEATDLGASWTYGPGTPVATLTGTAEQLLLLLWGRMPTSHDGFNWRGDVQAGLDILAGALTP